MDNRIADPTKLETTPGYSGRGSRRNRKAEAAHLIDHRRAQRWAAEEEDWIGVPSNSEGREPQRLLVIDGSDDDAILLQWAVARRHATMFMDWASDAVQARQILDRAAPTLIVLDCELPGKTSGLELLRELRLRASLIGVPIVMISETNSQIDLELAFALGANSFLCKPVCYGEYVRAVDLLLKHWLDANFSDAGKAVSPTGLRAE